MNVRLLHAATALYLAIFFVWTAQFSILPLALFAVALAVDYLTRLEQGVKNLLFLVAALSAIPPVLWIFLLLLPFSVFGSLLSGKGFSKSYILGFALSFITANIIYILTTYFSVRMNMALVVLLFYMVPALGAVVLRKKAMRGFSIGAKECLFVLFVLLSASVVAVHIIDDQSLFMANGVRIFTRVQVAFDGLQEGGMVPIYNPGIAQGDPTYLWNTPSFKVHVALLNYLVPFVPPILFVNGLSFFILFLSTIGLGVLLKAFVGREEGNGGEWSSRATIMVSVVSALIGLNFVFLQLLPRMMANYTYPIAYLLLAIILGNPRKFTDVLLMMYIAAILISIHLPYGSGILFIAGCLLLVKKWHCFRGGEEPKKMLGRIKANKAKGMGAVILIALIPLFYVSAGFMFSDFLDQDTRQAALTPSSMAKDMVGNIQSFVKTGGEVLHVATWNPLHILSGNYPDVRRIDDHRAGFFVAGAGLLSFLVLMAFIRSPLTRNFWLFVGAFALHLVLAGLFYSKLTIYFAGFWRTSYPFVLVIAGAAVLVQMSLWKSKVVVYALAAVMLFGFVHAVPYAKQNIGNIHQEMFASGEISTGELDFIRGLPNDGRILTYGMFNNAIDFGGNYLTGKYFSRDERAEFNLKRKLFEKVHGQDSFGEPDIVLAKSGVELANYLRLGGWKYLWLDARHPISQHVILELTPGIGRQIYGDVPDKYKSGNATDYAYPIYANGPFFMFTVNGSNYAEKVDVVRNLTESVYSTGRGYAYTAISPYYHFGPGGGAVDVPLDPGAVAVERVSPTEARLSGDFREGGYVVFKEYYFERWKAYMNGREVPVLSTIQELVLIKTEKGESITLVYGVLPKEKVVAAVSFLAHLGFIAFLLMVLRGEKGRKEEEGS